MIADHRARFRRWLLNALLRLFVKRRFRYDLDIAALRRLQQRLDARALRTASQLTRTSVDCGGAQAEWLTVPASAASRTILYLHGGGWMFESPGLHGAMLARWCSRLGARALMVRYRLAPEHRFPAGLDDCLACWHWLRAQGVAPQQIVLAGDSAGGNLVLALLHRLHEAGEPMPACAVALSPFVDFTLSSPSLVLNERRDPLFTAAALVGLRRLYLAPEQMLLPTASPLFGRFDGWPPLLLQASDSEVLRDDAVRLAERARADGAEVELELWAGLPHVFQALPWLPQSAHAIDRIAAFVQRHQSPDSP